MTLGGVILDKIKYKVYKWKDPRGFWRYRAYIKFPYKKAVVKTFSETGTEDPEANAWKFIFKVLDWCKNGESVDSFLSSDVMFDEYVDKISKSYLKEVAKDSKKSYRAYFGAFKEYFKDKPLKSLTNWDIKLFVQYLLNDKGLTNNTTKKYWMILKKIFKYAIRDGFITDNPCEGIKITVTEVIKNQPIENLIEVFRALREDDEVRRYCIFLFYTGLRPQDMIGLKQENLIERSGIKTIKLIQGKTQKQQLIPVHRVLERYISSENYLFDYDHDRNNAVSRLSRKFKMLMKKHHLNTDITPYWFRHTYEYKLEEAETPEMILRHLFGKPAKGSLNAYSHPNIRLMKEYIEKLPSVDFVDVMIATNEQENFYKNELLKAAGC